MPDLSQRLAAAPADISCLQDGLVDAAALDGSLDVAYRIVDSPLGQLLLARSPIGLLRVAFAVEGFDGVLSELASAVSPRILEAPGQLDAEARGVDQYFSGETELIDLPLDLRLVDGFRRAVIEHLPSIAYGRTASYADVAAAVGRPKAVRAVGSACGHNPVPIVVPCHRVVRSDGSIGQYLGGTEAKRVLLALEAA